MKIIGAIASIGLILYVLVEGFETLVVPRRVGRPYRFSRLYYRTAWKCCSGFARRLKPGKRRENFLSGFGPLSILGLFAFWVIGLIVGFGCLQWSLETALNAPGGHRDLVTYLYLSGVTFFTLGYGDVTALEPLGRFVTVVEAGMGFGFLAVVIGYLPVLYQAFSRREATISMLDARAGSPPSAAQLLLRLARAGDARAADAFFLEWERWAAELLESHLSFPVLSYYRSQHDNQSWLGAITTMLDTCALWITGMKEGQAYYAQLTFAMARHAVVDLALVFQTRPLPPEIDRLPANRLNQLRDELREAGLPLRDGPAVDAKMAELRGAYEPFVSALSRFLLFPLPPLYPEKQVVDNWQTSPWMRRTAGMAGLHVAETGDEHFAGEER